MNNSFEKSVRAKLGVDGEHLDPLQMSKITTLQIEDASQEDIDGLVNTPVSYTHLTLPTTPYV